MLPLGPEVSENAVDGAGRFEHDVTIRLDIPPVSILSLLWIPTSLCFLT